MFSIFQPKKFLVDHLGNFIDIHNHVLPNIDDGAKNLKASIELLNAYAAIGINDFIATPHIMNDYYDNNKNSIEKAYISLKKELEGSQLNPSIRYAAEYMMDANYEALLEDKQLMQLKNKYVLVEMSYFQAPLNLKDLIFKTFTEGFIPVLAHPERYSFYHSKFEKYHELKAQNIPFQLNILSLTNHYGTSVQKIANKLLTYEMIDFLATDTHHIEHLKKLREIKLNANQLKLLIPIIEKTKESFKND